MNDFRIGDWIVQPQADQLQRDGQQVPLQPKAMDVLATLARRPGVTFSTEALLEAVWPDSFPEPQVVRRRITELRQALGDDPKAPRYIETRPKRGYRLIAPVEPLTASEPTISASPAEDWEDLPFVGREPLLKRLSVAFAAARAGHCRLMLLVGEAGIGKTRLASAACSQFEGAMVFQGWCDEAAFAPPFLVWKRVLREMLHAAPILRLEELMDDSAIDALGSIGSELTPGRTPAEVSVSRLPALLADAMVALIQQIEVRGPVALVLDDLHRADEGSLEVLERVARIPKQRLLIIGALRDSEIERRSPLSNSLAELARLQGHERLQLTGLSIDEIRSLLSRVGSTPVDENTLCALLERTDGVPLFVSEYARAVLQGEPAALQQQVPLPLQTLLLGRLNALSEEEIQLIEAASVQGRDFRTDALRQVIGASEAAAEESIQAAQRLGFFGIGPTKIIRFRHIIIRDAVYQDLSDRRRKSLHEVTAKALLELDGEEPEDQTSLQVAQHLAAAGIPLQAARWYYRSYLFLLRKGYRDARRCATEWLEAMQPHPGMSEKARRRLRLTTAGAASCCLYSMAMLDKTPEIVNYYFEQGLSALGNPRPASPPSDPEAANLLVNLHVLYSDCINEFDSELAIEHARHAVTIAKTLDDELLFAEAAFTLVDRHWNAGQLDAVQAVAPQVLETSPSAARSVMGADDVNEHMPVARTRDRVAHCCLLRGQLREGLQHLETAFHLRRRDQRRLSLRDVCFTYDPSSYAGSEHQWLEHLLTAANALRFAGDWYHLDACVSAHERLSSQISVPYPRLLSFVLRARLLSMRGHWRQLEALIQSLQKNELIIGSSSQQERARRHIQIWQAEVDAHLQNAKEPILDSVPAILERHSAISSNILRIDHLLRLIRAWIWCQGTEGSDYAETLLKSVETLIKRTGMHCYTPFAHELRAQLNNVASNDTMSSQQIEFATRIWRQIDAHPHIERMNQELTQLRERWR